MFMSRRTVSEQTWMTLLREYMTLRYEIHQIFSLPVKLKSCPIKGVSFPRSSLVENMGMVEVVAASEMSLMVRAILHKLCMELLNHVYAWLTLMTIQKLFTGVSINW